ncbi:FCD domain-containing protein [Ancylobacter sp. Lp-2]|uniref:FadR/GntR family transcriptional regulator n=1 Tax=Ancylobacter sp. Lp-2 TaxID=2881339 RepID=UPI001E28D3D9|nr:FCD domain-containing protein [Ancylobacter sp. Lp-2]MCB4769660.1 FCD domain-containing protein [Ancylobacter sp. Lp-2]
MSSSTSPPLDHNDTLLRLRHYLGEQQLGLNDRLPPERELCVRLHVSRAELRKAMAVLESEGQVWRHVGRGTFIGARPVLNLDDVRFLSSITSPMQILEARFAIEPELARLAALHGVSSDVNELRLCNRRCREARSWRVFESWDNRLHYAVAAASKNKLLMTLFETLNAVRRSLVWKTLRVDTVPPGDHVSFAEHDALCEAIIRHDAAEAERFMRAHLASVRSRLLPGKAGDRQPG